MWVQSERLLGIGNAFIPLSFESGDSAQGPWHVTVARQDFAYSTERSFRSAVISQHPVFIITQSEQGFRRVRLQFLSIIQGFFLLHRAEGSYRHCENISMR